MSKRWTYWLSGFGLSFLLISTIVSAKLASGGKHDWLAISLLALVTCINGGNWAVARGIGKGKLKPIDRSLTTLKLNQPGPPR